MALTLDGDNGISGINGSATTPAVQGTDTNTGLTFGTDTVNVVTGGTTRATVDANGDFSVNTDAIFVDASADRVGIGTTTPSSQLELAGSAPVITLDATGSSQPTINFQQSGTTYGKILFDGNNVQVGSTYGATIFIAGGSGNEYARVANNGSFCIMSTDTSMNTFGTIFTPANNTSTQPAVLNFSKTHSGAVDAVVFRYNGSRKGSITFNDSSTTFTTSSDYRLKENVVDLDGAIDRVKQLAPKRFNFIDDPSQTVDGFIAHEAQTVVPEAVTGVKDEVEVWHESEILPEGVLVGDNKFDEDGNTIPLPQGIDQSKLVPLLTAALQEAIGKIEALETRVAQLEGGAA